MEIPFEHVLRYTNENNIPIHEIAASLIATNELAVLIPPVLESLFPGLSIQKIELNLQSSAVAGSREDDYKGKLICDFQESVEGAISRIGERTGVQALQEHSKLISLVIIGLILLGGIWLHSQLFPSEKAIHIEGDYNTIINLTADEAGLPPETVKDAIEKALTERDKAKLGKNAVDITQPAKRERRSTIQGGPDRSVELSRETIDQFPGRGDLVEEAEPSDQVFGLRVDIRRLDKDERHVGWIGQVTIGEYTGRIKLVLVPGIDPEKLKDLSDKGPIIVDGIVFFRKGRNGELRPYVIHVYSVQGLENGSGDLTQAGDKEQEN